MRTLAFIFCVISTLFLAGCVAAYVPPVWDASDEIYSADQIQKGVTTRDEVLDLLGEPDEGDENDRIIIYKGSSSKGYFIMVGMITGADGLISPQDWRIAIYFDEHDVVQDLTSWQGSPDYDTEREFVLAELEKRAHEGDPQAMYEYAYRLDDVRDSWKWYCRSAHQKHVRAQHEMGRFYETGTGPVSRDLLAAYIWYSLAEINGFEEIGGSNYRRTADGWACCFPDKTRRENLAEELDFAQNADAEHRVAVWQPNPAECELEMQVEN